MFTNEEIKVKKQEIDLALSTIPPNLKIVLGNGNVVLKLSTDRFAYYEKDNIIRLVNKKWLVDLIYYISRELK